MANKKQNPQNRELLEACLNSLTSSNDQLTKRQQELEQTLNKQLRACERLKERLRELNAQTKILASERDARKREIAALEAKIERAHTKIFNTAFTAGVITREVTELINSQSFVWTNFLRYTNNTVFNWSLAGKVNFMRTVLRRIFLKKRMNLPSALRGIDREFHLLNAALSELCEEVNPGDGTTAEQYAAPAAPANYVPPRPAIVTQWQDIFASRESIAFSKNVVISTILFYDADGRKYMHGGAERYVVELFGILRDMGYEATVVQAGNSDWELKHPTPYGDLPVKALHSELSFEAFSTVLNEYLLGEPSPLVIYSPFMIGTLYAAPNSIGISHGIFWDNWWYHSTLEVEIGRQKAICQAFSNCHEIVSVDTNTINWFRTIASDAEIRTFYIPNFVDKKDFHPPVKPRRDDRVRVVYPRRLYAARGFDLVREAFPKLFAEYPELELELIGQIDDSAAKNLKRFLADFPGRVSHRCCPPEEMPQVYRDADIALVPTCYSEGTSLSCLEAMASGCAVIATNVGGLPELVTNGYNGLLIAPEAEELYAAVKKLLDDRELRRKLAENAIATSDCYELGIWREAWRKILKRKLSVAVKPALEFVQLAAPGMTWSTMKQRPQQLFQSLAQAGCDSTYISDEPYVNPSLFQGCPCKLHIQPVSFTPQLNGKYLYLYYADIIYHRNFSYGELIRNSNCKIIFDILDDPSIHTNAETGKVDPTYMKNFDLLLHKADFVITSARQLYDKYRKVRPDIEMVFNGVNVEDFDLREAPPRPDDLPDRGRRIVGYYGALAQWVDFDLIYEAAQAMPEVDFVLIGLNVCEDEVARLTALDNVSFLGMKPYDVLANYLWYFDVATIPFKINPITDAASPIKLFEYCASGTPVVTTAFSEVKQYGDKGVFVGADHADCIEKLRMATALTGNELADLQKRLREIAAGNTWGKRAETIIGMIEKRNAAEAEQANKEAEDVPAT